MSFAAKCKLVKTLPKLCLANLRNKIGKQLGSKNRNWSYLLSFRLSRELSTNRAIFLENGLPIFIKFQSHAHLWNLMEIRGNLFLSPKLIVIYNFQHFNLRVFDNFCVSACVPSFAMSAGENNLKIYDEYQIQNHKH